MSAPFIVAASPNELADHSSGAFAITANSSGPAPAESQLPRQNRTPCSTCSRQPFFFCNLGSVTTVTTAAIPALGISGAVNGACRGLGASGLADGVVRGAAANGNPQCGHEVAWDETCLLRSGQVVSVIRFISAAGFVAGHWLRG
jgi:hypothetical protein